MEENQVYGVPTQNVGYGEANVNMNNTFVGNEVNTFVNNNVTSYVQEPVVAEAQVQEPTVAEAQVYAPAETVIAQEQVVETPAPAQVAPKILQSPIEFKEGDVRIVASVADLKSALAKANVVATKIDIKPVSEVVMIRVTDRVNEHGQTILQIRASDRENILTVEIPAIEATAGASMTVKVDTLKQFMDKAPGDAVALVIDGYTVTIYTTSGEFKLSQTLDLSTNLPIIIPDIDKESILLKDTVELPADKFFPQLLAANVIAEKIPETSSYKGIYFGDKIYATTGDSVASVNSIFQETFNMSAFLKIQTVKDIVSMGVGDTVRIGFDVLNGVKTMCIYTNGYRLYSVLHEGEADYPLEEIAVMLGASKGEAVKVNKNTLLGAVDRANIFFTSGLVRTALNLEVENGVLYLMNENKTKERISVEGNGNFKLRLDVKDINNIIKNIKTEYIYIAPIGEMGLVSHVHIWDGAETVYVTGTSL